LFKPLGSLITEGVLWGHFIAKNFVEKYDPKMLDDLNNDPEALNTTNMMPHLDRGISGPNV